ncbi:MAG: 30S ribosomal protein S15 [Chlorobiaceae bacterium]
MSLTKEHKAEVITQFGGSGQNTGKSEVQAALFSSKITDLTGHLKLHPKDKHSRRGLLILVSKRKKVLNYIKKVDIDRYRKVIATLELRK